MQQLLLRQTHTCRPLLLLLLWKDPRHVLTALTLHHQTAWRLQQQQQQQQQRLAVMIVRGQSGQLLPSHGSASGQLQAAPGSGDSNRRSGRRLPPLPPPPPLRVLVVGWWWLSSSSSKLKQQQW
jgi:hypothetical protein